jgi:SAM-dependent methyltransferase
MSGLTKAKRIAREALAGRLGLHLRRKFGGRAAAFRAIYRLAYWNAGASQESVSGPGSTLAFTESLRGWIGDVIRRRQIRSVFDAACGDFNWMRLVDLHGASYLGVDIVPELIAAVSARHAAPDRCFEAMDIVESPVGAFDLILCRDCLIHLPTEDVREVLQNFSRGGGRFALITTSPGLRENIHLGRAGGWRPVNLRLPPYSLCEPLESFPDYVARKPEHSTVLALWSLPFLSGPP